MKLNHLINALKFLIQFGIFGLAIAFVLLITFPDRFLSNPEIQANNNNPIAGNNPAAIYSYNDAISLAAPAVVNVYARQLKAQQSNPLFQDPLFRRFFPDIPQDQEVNNNLGSGVILNDSGYLLTNAHVITEANDIQVTLYDGRQTTAEVVGVDTETDLAVLQIDLNNLPVAPIGKSDILKVGDVVMAIGNPYNFGQTVTQGIISATRRNSVGINLIEDFIQTDAAINPGNSGGALINAKGELVGINTAIVSNTGGSQGIGFAIPIDQAIDVMQQLINRGFVERGWLGIIPQPVPADISEAMGLNASGIFVTAIFNGSPAANAGVMPGDIIIEVNGLALLDSQQAVQIISSYKPGEIINLDIIRNWDRIFLTAEVTQRPKTIR
ncbi:MAG: trypsin-like serine protease [Gammaproteobacteria bacterium]|nr:trypsin-like serine protease [Gammaproteobacteria bacterium]